MENNKRSVIHIGLTTQSHGQSMTPHKRNATNRMVSASAKPRPTLVSAFFIPAALSLVAFLAVGIDEVPDALAGVRLLEKIEKTVLQMLTDIKDFLGALMLVHDFADCAQEFFSRSNVHADPPSCDPIAVGEVTHDHWDCVFVVRLIILTSGFQFIAGSELFPLII
jgi:hypothetical protein